MKINVEELKETAELLAEVTPANTEEMADLCAELHAARDAEDAIAKAEREATAELAAQLAAAREPYRLQRAAAAGVVSAATAALVRRLDADERAALAAIEAGQPVPAPRDLPPGLRATRKTVLQGVDMAKLPKDYHATVADVDHILRDAEAGLEVPGAQVEIVLGAVYTRPKAKK